MQFNVNFPNYKPLEIQSNHSVSSERKRDFAENLKNMLEETGAVGAEWYVAPESHINAYSYLKGGDSNLSFKDSVQESLASQAESKMQNFMSLRNLATNIDMHSANNKHSFGGYETDSLGFMGEDFNQAAHLPSDYKIHKNALQALNDFYTVSAFAEFESIDLIAGISVANRELNSLLTENKEYYTKEEIMQFTKGSNAEFYENDFETLLMQDYSNEKGEFKKEGIMLMYAMKSGVFYDIESPYTIKREEKKNQEESITADNTKEKTPEEKAKEIKETLNEYYLKAIESSRIESGKEDKGGSIYNTIMKELQRDRVGQLEMERVTKKDHTSFGGEWIKVFR